MDPITLHPLHLLGIVLLAGTLVGKAYYQGYRHGRTAEKKEHI